MPIYKNVDKNFFKKWSKDMSYVLGFFAADGYITVNRRGAHFWNIQITDKKLLESIREVTQSEHKISIRKRGNNQKTIYRLQIGSREMCDDLRKLGFKERKTKSLVIPNVPKKYFSDFVRGYFDGDGNVWTGYVHKERKSPLLVIRVVFTSCSKDFLETLMAKLTKIGVGKSVIRKEKNSYYRLTFSIHGSLRLYDFMYNHSAHSSKSLFLPRKKKTFETYRKMRL